MMNKGNAPSAIKILGYIFPFVLVIGGFTYMHLKSKRITKAFYEMSVNSVVIKTSDWKKRSIDFYLDNNMTLNFLAPADDKMQVGDSIRKASKTFKYDVYRRDINKQYQWYTSYDYSKFGH